MDRGTSASKARTELLAPAGDIEAGYAALYYGADAIYLGLQQFSARATATNFDEENLNRFVGYAHSLNRKVYVTVNTVVQEGELPDLLSTLDICSRCSVDGLIIQDLGVVRIVRESYPELEMHASTQMAVHNKEGALALQKLGFSRVVVARELTLPEIREIAAIPNLETEAFVHGALCYSYSGLCLFSSMESGRSANRGKCLYPCRAEFDGEAGKAHYFSMKDMALQTDVLKMPVTSLKIEGRKKTALYVAAVTDYYRRLLDGKDVGNGAENIKQIFSRPWCKFHFNGRDKAVIERNFVGHRGLSVGKIERLGKRSIVFHTKHNIGRYDGLQIEIPGMEKPFGFSVQQLKENGKNVFEAKTGQEVEIGLPPQTPELAKGMELYLASSTAVKGAYDYTKPKPNEYLQKPEVNVKVEITSNNILAKCNNLSVNLSGNFAPAEYPEKVAEAANKSFAKDGDAAIKLGRLEIENPQNLFVPISVMNELRRQLYSQIEPKNKHGKLPEAGNPAKVDKTQWIIRTDDITNLADIDLNEVAEIEVLLNENFDISILQRLPKNKIRLVLPAVNRRVGVWKPLIEKLLAQGFGKWTIGNYWGRDVLPEKGIDLAFDAPLYMLNTQAVVMAKQMGATRANLAAEDTLPNMQALTRQAPLPMVLDIYADMPLFRSAACIRTNECKVCPRGIRWLNLRKEGREYEALSKDCQIMLFDKRPYCLSEYAQAINPAYYRVSFAYKKYTASQAAAIWSKMRKFESLSDSYCGNLARGVI